MYQYPYQNTYNPYNTYNNNIARSENIEAMIDESKKKIAELEKLRDQAKQMPQQLPTNLTQNFQIAPNSSNGIRYATSIDEVNRENVFADTPFFSKDLSVLWIKRATGEIKAYELNEIIEKDEKDMQIELLQAQQEEKDNKIDLLQAQLDELKGMIRNEQFNTNVDETRISEDTTTNDESIGRTTKTSKSTSLSRVSKSTKG